VHVDLWAAEMATHVEGDFVECGVNRAFLSRAIVEYLSWDSLGRSFYLFDSFDGIDESQLTAEERDRGRAEMYRRAKQRNEVETDVEEVRRTFARFQRVTDGDSWNCMPATDGATGWAARTPWLPRTSGASTWDSFG
jgi:hypothetical protein